ncbi:hypothetical protein BGZ46_010658 [Entomortierella lignicola]|nr:hypothetical protein BGZ46_010658 [Entomortierella lignicola]
MNVIKDSSAPTARRKVISSNNDHIYDQHCQCNNISTNPTSLAPLPSPPPVPPLPPPLPIKAKRPKRISATFGGPGSESGSRTGSGSGSSHSTSTSSLPSAPLSPLSESFTQSPVTLSANTDPITSVEDPLPIRQQPQSHRQHPLAMDPSPLISGTFGLYTLPPVPEASSSSHREKITLTDEISISSSLRSNSDGSFKERGRRSTYDQKAWSPTSSRARFTFGYDDDLKEEDVLNILPPSTSPLFPQNNDNDDGDINANNNNNCNNNNGADNIQGKADNIIPMQDDSKESQTNVDQSLLPLPLSTNRIPRLHSTPSKLELSSSSISVNPSVESSATTPTNTTGFQIPRRSSTKRYSFTSAIAAVTSGEGLQRIYSTRRSSRSKHFGDNRNNGDESNENNLTTLDNVNNNSEGVDYKQNDVALIAQHTPLPPSPRSKRQRLSFLANKLISSLSPAASTAATPTMIQTSIYNNTMINTAAGTTNSPIFSNNVSSLSLSKMPSRLSSPSSNNLPFGKISMESNSSQDAAAEYPIPVNVNTNTNKLQTLANNTTATPSRSRRSTISTIFSSKSTPVTIPPVVGSLPKPLHVLFETTSPPPAYFYNEYPRHRHSREHLYQDTNPSSPVSVTSSGTSANALAMDSGPDAGGVGASGVSTYYESIPMSTTTSVSPVDLSDSIVTPSQDIKAKKNMKKTLL